MATQHRKDYQAKWLREWRQKNPELAKKRDDKYAALYRKKRNTASNNYYLAHKDDPEYRDKTRKRGLKYYHQNKDKAAARTKVGKAVLTGKLDKPTTCSNCNQTKPIEGHHSDYSKPLDVTWLCKKCHELIHH